MPPPPEPPPPEPPPLPPRRRLPPSSPSSPPPPSTAASPSPSPPPLRTPTGIHDLATRHDTPLHLSGHTLHTRAIRRLLMHRPLSTRTHDDPPRTRTSRTDLYASRDYSARLSPHGTTLRTRSANTRPNAHHRLPSLRLFTSRLLRYYYPLRARFSAPLFQNAPSVRPSRSWSSSIAV